VNFKPCSSIDTFKSRYGAPTTEDKEEGELSLSLYSTDSEPSASSSEEDGDQLYEAPLIYKQDKRDETLEALRKRVTCSFVAVVQLAHQK
jgi:hypothetical protein